MNNEDRQALTEGAVKITRGVVELARTTAEFLGSAQIAAEESREKKVELLAAVLSSLSPYLGSILGVTAPMDAIEEVKRGAALLIGTRQSSSLYLAAERAGEGLRPVLVEKTLPKSDRSTMDAPRPFFIEHSAGQAIAAGWYLEAILSELARKLAERLAAASESSARLEDLTERLRLTIKMLWK